MNWAEYNSRIFYVLTFPKLFQYRFCRISLHTITQISCVHAVLRVLILFFNLTNQRIWSEPPCWSWVVIREPQTSLIQIREAESLYFPIWTTHETQLPKTLEPKLLCELKHMYIRRKETAWPGSQFLQYVSVSDLYVPMIGPWQACRGNINRSQTHECGHLETDHYNNSVLEITRPRSFISGITLIGTRNLQCEQASSRTCYDCMY